MNPTESGLAIVEALRTAAANRITASIAAAAVDDDDAPGGYFMTFTVTVFGFSTHFRDDLAAAAEDLAKRVAEYVNAVAEYVARQADQP